MLSIATQHESTMTNAELIDAMRHNYIAYFRLFGGQHGVRMNEDEETAWIIANRPPGNHILRASFPDLRVEERIEALLRTIHSLTGGIRWLVFPTDQPHDLADRLERRGLTPGRGDSWMSRALHRLPLQTNDPALRISPVTDGPELRAWWTASARGFGMTQRAAQLWYDAYRRHGWAADSYCLNYCGRIGRETVTTGTLILAAGIAGIYDISTPPAFRNKGHASALVSHLLTEARQRGYSHAGLHTGDAVAFYQRLGFTVVSEEREYFWTAGD